MAIKGAKKQKSSGELYKFLEDRTADEYIKAEKKYKDRGQSGIDAELAANRESVKAQLRDEKFVFQYGKDAPKARGFGTKAYSNPPRKPKM